MNREIFEESSGGGGSSSEVKKKTRGRKKIEIKKVEKLNHRLVTFSKRRAGLFNKASELCLLTGAEIAIILQSHGKRVFSFSHPPENAVIYRFLLGGEKVQEPRDNLTAVIRDYNGQYYDVCKEVEKKREETVQEHYTVEGGGGTKWWYQEVDGMRLEELEQFGAALEELIMNIDVKVDEHKLIQSAVVPANPMTMRNMPMEAAAPMTMHNKPMESAPSLFEAEMAPSLDDTMVFLNQNQSARGDDFNCESILPYDEFR